MQEMKDVQLKPVRKVGVDYVKVLGMVLVVWGAMLTFPSFGICLCF